MTTGKTKTVLDSPEIAELTDRIANLLGETEKRALFGIRAVIGVNGSEFALRCLVQAAKMKRGGGTMKTDDGTYRTLGGMWFKIAKNNMTSSQRYRYMALTNPRRTNDKERSADKNGR